MPSKNKVSATFRGVTHSSSQKAFFRSQGDCCLVLYLKAQGCKGVAQHMRCLGNMPNGIRINTGGGLSGHPMQQSWLRVGWE